MKVRTPLYKVPTSFIRF